LLKTDGMGGYSEVIRIVALFHFLRIGYDRNMTSLEKSILSTLVYYDVLERPLTGFEVFNLLISKKKKKINFYQVLDLLENSSELNKLINQKNGLYFLKGRSGIVKERIERQKIADRKWRKARRVIGFFQLIPFVRMVAVSGSLAVNNPKKESDIDLLIATESGRIWTCRGIVTLFTHLIGQRRHGALTNNRFCLNHYLTDNSLKIPFRSLYNAQTYAHLMPILEIEKGLYRKFQRANQWIGSYLAFYPKEEKGYCKTIKLNSLFTFTRKLREFFLNGRVGNSLESILKRFQEKRIKKDPLTYRSGGRVVFDDNQLEFHPDSPEKEILKKYNWKMKEMGFVETEENSGLNT